MRYVESVNCIDWVTLICTSHTVEYVCLLVPQHCLSICFSVQPSLISDHTWIYWEGKLLSKKVGTLKEVLTAYSWVLLWTETVKVWYCSSLNVYLTLDLTLPSYLSLLCLYVICWTERTFNLAYFLVSLVTNRTDYKPVVNVCSRKWQHWWILNLIVLLGYQQGLMILIRLSNDYTNFGGWSSKNLNAATQTFKEMHSWWKLTMVNR